MKIRSIPAVLSLIVFLSLLSCSSSHRGVIIACMGDSLTESSYPRHLLKTLAREGVRAKIINFGRSGFTSGEYLNYLEKNQPAIAAAQPDFILVQLGTNDVRIDHDRTSKEQFFSNMKNILGILSQLKNPEGKKTRILLATIPPIPLETPFPFSSDSQRRVMSEINPVIFQIGKEQKISIVDNYTVFIESPQFLPEVHPTEEGYKLLAGNWFVALKPLLK